MSNHQACGVAIIVLKIITSKSDLYVKVPMGEWLKKNSEVTAQSAQTVEDSCKNRYHKACSLLGNQTLIMKLRNSQARLYWTKIDICKFLWLPYENLNWENVRPPNLTVVLDYFPEWANSLRQMILGDLLAAKTAFPWVTWLICNSQKSLQTIFLHLTRHS